MLPSSTAARAEQNSCQLWWKGKAKGTLQDAVFLRKRLQVLCWQLLLPTFCTCTLGSITGLLLSSVVTWCSWPTSGLTGASSAPSPAPAASLTELSSLTTATWPAAAFTSSISSLWWLGCRCTLAAGVQDNENSHGRLVQSSPHAWGWARCLAACTLSPVQRSQTDIVCLPTASCGNVHSVLVRAGEHNPCIALGSRTLASTTDCCRKLAGAHGRSWVRSCHLAPRA